MIVAEISQLSKAAGQRLPKSRVGSHTGTDVTLEFERQVDADWMNRNPALQREIVSRWAATGGWTPVLRFVCNGRTGVAPEVETVAVELPLEGTRLAEATHEVFGMAPVDGGPGAPKAK